VEEKAKIPIAGFFISPLATAATVLNDIEKELGCALVEFGAGITYVSIYKGKILRYMVAIPLGGNVITKDITDLGVTEKNAEDLKINFGDALLEQDNEERINPGKLLENSLTQNEIELRKLHTVIEARADEIIANVVEQIKLSGYMPSLGAGIVITGGGASLKNLRSSLQAKSGKDVRIISARKTLVNQASEITNQPENSTIIGLLTMGKENCAKEKPVAGSGLFGDTEVKKPVPPVNVSGDSVKEEKKPKHEESTEKKSKKKENWFKKKVDRFTSDLFGDENNAG
jgi:cell division protein FtsA